MTNKKMRIVVTGASGFLGSWVCGLLAETHEVTALVRSDSSNMKLIGIEGPRIISTLQKSSAKQINKIDPDAYISMEWTGVGNKDRNELFQNENVARTSQLHESLNPIPMIKGTGSQAELGPVSDFISECKLFCLHIHSKDISAFKFESLKTNFKYRVNQTIKGEEIEFEYFVFIQMIYKSILIRVKFAWQRKNEI